jgi:hypothetical protein
VPGFGELKTLLLSAREIVMTDIEGVPRPRRSLRDPALAPTQRLSGSCRE